MHFYGNGAVGVGLPKRGLYYAIRFPLCATTFHVGHIMARVRNTNILEVRVVAVSFYLWYEWLLAHNGHRRIYSRYSQ